MNRLLWVLQIVFGIYFIVSGAIHLIVPEGLPDAVGWMYDLPTSVHIVVGTAEILGGLGLVLPGLTGMAPGLTVLAAAGLATVMICAAVWHATRGEFPQLAINFFDTGVLVFIGYGRWKVFPHPSRA